MGKENKTQGVDYDYNGNRLLAAEANDGSGHIVMLLADSVTQALEVTGHVIVDNAAGVNSPVAIDPSVVQTDVNYDLTSDPANLYIGTAVKGSANSAAVWTIKQIALDANGNPTQARFNGPTAIWDNRASLAYT